MYKESVIPIMLLIVILAGPVRADNAEIRRELEHIADMQLRAFKAKDVKAYMKYLASDYSTKTLEGNSLSLTRSELEQEIVSDMEDTVSIDFVIRDIRNLKVVGNEVIAVVNQKSSRVVKAENSMHKWEICVIQKEKWIKTDEGLKLSLIEMVEVKYSKRDGKSITVQKVG